MKTIRVRLGAALGAPSVSNRSSDCAESLDSWQRRAERPGLWLHAACEWLPGHTSRHLLRLSRHRRQSNPPSIICQDAVCRSPDTGDATTIPITPQYTQGITVGISIVTATHDGQSAFTVQAIADNQISVLVAATGQYRGARPLVVQDNVSFQVNADGNWTLRVEPLRNGGQPSFSGTGDNVSLFFNPPPPGQWLISGAWQKAVDPTPLRQR